MGGAWCRPVSQHVGSAPNRTTWWIKIITSCSLFCGAAVWTGDRLPRYQVDEAAAPPWWHQAGEAVWWALPVRRKESFKWLKVQVLIGWSNTPKTHPNTEWPAGSQWCHVYSLWCCSANRWSVVSDSSPFTFPLAENGKWAQKIYLENLRLIVNLLCDVCSWLLMWQQPPCCIIEWSEWIRMD